MDPNEEEPTKDPSTTKKKVAFCFMIYNCIENEAVWVEFFSKADPQCYNIYVHAKSKYEGAFAQHVIPEYIDTKYADISLVKCSNALFRAAYNHDEANARFVLLSGHCIPVKTFAHIYGFLLSEEKAYVHQCSESERFPRLTSVLTYIEKDNLTKHHQWIILTRQDVAIVKDDPCLEWFKNVYAPDEAYYLSTLQHFQCARHIHRCFEAIDSPTFTNWEGHKNYAYYKPHNGLHVYRHISEEELAYLVSHTPFPLFARKFSRGSVKPGYLERLCRS
jgi:hypothetical protein